MLHLRARDEDVLTEVEGEVHDWFFDLADVTHDRTERRVVIPFRRWSYDEARPLPAAKSKWPWFVGRRWSPTEWEAPWYRWLLTVEQVTSLTIEDEAQIGTADFNTVSYDSRARALTIDCAIPVTLCFQVDALDVHVEETTEVLGIARYRTAGGSGSAVSYSGEVLPLNPRP